MHGWWNGIATADLDGNGWTDFVVTNFGTNTKYGSPTAEKPRKLFYGDLDEDGYMDLVEAKIAKGDQLLPVRGRSCSCEQMPSLKEKFPSYREFALADLAEIYELDRTEELFANELHSVVILNFGRWELLGKTAAVSGAGSTRFWCGGRPDFDLDGIPDIFLAQNFYGPQIETGDICWRFGRISEG